MSASRSVGDTYISCARRVVNRQAFIPSSDLGEQTLTESR